MTFGGGERGATEGDARAVGESAIEPPDRGRPFNKPGLGLPILLMAAGAGLLAFVPAARADSNSIRATVGEKIQYDDNIRLEPNPSGWVFGSTTSLDIEAETRAPLADLGLNLGAALNRFTGPGATSGLDSLDWNAGLGLNKHTSRAHVGARAEYRQQSVRESEIEESGRTSGDVDRITKSANASFAYDLTSRDVVGIAGGIRDISFSGDQADGQRTPYVAGDATLRWTSALTPRDTGTASFRTTVFDADNSQNTFSKAFTVGVSYERQQTPRLTLRGAIGGGIVVEDRDVTSGQATTRQTETSPTVNFMTGATYALERSRVSIEITQDIQPSARGTPEERRSARLKFAYDATSTATIDLSAAYTNQSVAVDDFRTDQVDRNFLNVEAALNWRFLPAWHFSTGYRYRRDDDAEGLATSNMVFALLRYDFTIRP